MRGRSGSAKAGRAGGGWPRLYRPALLLAFLPLLAGAGGLPPETPAWLEVRTPAFALIANVHEQRATEIAVDLETFRRVLEREVPGLRPASRPLTIYAFDSRKTLQRHYPAAPRGVGGVFLRGEIGDIVLVDAGTTIRQQHAFHEYVHFRLRDSFLALPAWLNEGLAYYYQTFRRVGDGAEVGGDVPGLGRKSSLALVDLLTATATSEDYATRGFARASWDLVHFLESRSAEGDLARRASVEPATAAARVLAAIAGGQRDEDALRVVLGMPPAEIESALNAYVASGALRPRPIRVEPDAAGDAPRSRRVRYAEALARLAELSEAVEGDQATARTLFEAALARSPEDPRALLGSARVLVAAGDRATAAARVDAALTLDPTNARGYLQRGTIAMSEFAAWRAARPDGAAQALHPSLVGAREAFQRALSLDPGLLPAIRGYARTFLFDPETRQPGIDACARALAQRDDLDLSLTLVELYSDDANLDDAHATRRDRVLPWRNLLAVHDSDGGAAAWTRVEDALARDDMLLAERLYEKGRLDQAVEVLRAARDGATGKAHERISALLADMSARPRR